MFFFLLVGTKSALQDDAAVIPEERFCPRCGRRERFRGVTRRTYLTVFLIPLLPLSGARPGLACGTCGQFVPAGPHWTQRVRLDD